MECFKFIQRSSFYFQEGFLENNRKLGYPVFYRNVPEFILMCKSTTQKKPYFRFSKTSERFSDISSFSDIKFKFGKGNSTYIEFYNPHSKQGKNPTVG